MSGNTSQDEIFVEENSFIFPHKPHIRIRQNGMVVKIEEGMIKAGYKKFFLIDIPGIFFYSFLH